MRGASQLQEKEHSNGEELTRNLLEVVNCFRPYYGFNERDNTVYPRTEWLFDMSVQEKENYRTEFREAPWKVATRTMIFGRDLVRKIGAERILATPATCTQVLSDVIAIWGPRGLLDEGKLAPYLEFNFELENQFLREYISAVSEHLNLGLEHNRM